jgi:hypothetical protein
MVNVINILISTTSPGRRWPEARGSKDQWPEARKPCDPEAKGPANLAIRLYSGSSLRYGITKKKKRKGVQPLTRIDARTRN